MHHTIIRLAAGALLLGALVSSPAQAGHYGVALPEGEATTIDAAAARVADFSGKPALFSGRITEVCQKEGCWLVIENNGQAARVMVKDHAFAVPKDASGRVVVYGVLSEKLLSDEAAAHLAEDAGRAQPVAKRELRITATAVSIAD